MRARLRWLPVTVFVAAVVVLPTVFWHAAEHWIAHATGSYNCPPSGNGNGCINGTPHNYPFFSGWGSDFIPAIITVCGLLAGYWWHNQCHVSGCFWVGLPHRTAAGDRACFVHHPEAKLTHLRLHERHHAVLAADDKLDEIHRHVSALTPEAGNFPPPDAG